MNTYKTEDVSTVMGRRVLTQAELEARRRRLLKRLEWVPEDRPPSRWVRLWRSIKRLFR